MENNILTINTYGDVAFTLSAMLL